MHVGQKFRAELHLLHVLPKPEEDEPEIAPNEISVERAYQRAVRRLPASVPEEIYKRLNVTHVVRWGKPYREILAYAQEQDVDLVCMGALGGILGCRHYLDRSPIAYCDKLPVLRSWPARYKLRFLHCSGVLFQDLI